MSFYDPVSDGTVAMRPPADTSEASIDVWRYAPDPKTGVVMARPEHVAALKSIGFTIITSEAA